MTVISLTDERTKRAPHREGPARCLNCKGEWHAVAPVGTVALQCPHCLTLQGLFVGLSSTNAAQWQCKCGEYTFFIDEAGSYCAHCGTRPRFV
jgi:hypothetical protein